MAKAKIRNVKSNDLSDLTILIKDLGYDISTQDLSANLNDLLIHPYDRILVAEYSQQLTGMIAIHIIQMFHQREKIGRITALVVKQASQNQGIGTQLVNEAENYFKSCGCNRIEVVSSAKRERAHQFYIKNKYKTYTGKRFIKFIQ